LNLRPPGYEPGELPDCSTPRRRAQYSGGASILSMRVAAVDLGTNSTRLLVADVRNGRLEEVVRRLKITRLGEGVDERRRLLPAPIARVRNVLADFRREAEQLGAQRTLAIATSAIRDAENGEAFLGEIEWSYGFSTRLLSGHDEAQLTFRGIAAEREISAETLIVDVGGGSTELVAGGPDGLRFHDSLDLGCVRLTERFLHSDPPSEAELAECAAAVRSLLAERVPDDVRPATAIGVAGTITSLAALDLGLAQYDPGQVHGHRFTRTSVDEQLARLASLPVAERRELPALDPDRAPVIVAGAVILRQVLDHFGLTELEASERDILDGAALEAAGLPESEEGAAPPGAYTCC
jgi:exopolyphosphatase/guanosine-5'-triphosphate,3'-diphosphate pyrophosphatase